MQVRGRKAVGQQRRPGCLQAGFGRDVTLFTHGFAPKFLYSLPFRPSRAVIGLCLRHGFTEQSNQRLTLFDVIAEDDMAAQHHGGHPGRYPVTGVAVGKDLPRCVKLIIDLSGSQWVYLNIGQGHLRRVQ